MYQIELTPGTAYTIAVSAINKHGRGIRRYVNDNNPVTPPVVVPGLPTSVGLSVSYGNDDSLLVNYSPPFDGGARSAISRGARSCDYNHYRDPTTTFQSPIAEIFDCQYCQHAVWTVTTAITNKSSSISDGYFYLTLRRGGSILTTDAIPYDAPARAADEVPGVTY